MFKALTRLLALFVALQPSLVLAQSAPANLPYHTVYGRLGAAPGDTGPGQAIPFDTLKKGLGLVTVEVTPEQFGYGCALPGCIPYGTGDVTPAITAAVASVSSNVCVKVNFGPQQYNYRTPYTAARDCVWLAGQGYSTRWYFTPASCNTSMITYHGPDPGHPISFGRISDAMILSPDHSCVKVGINLIDIGDMVVSNIYFPIWSDTTFSSVGLQTNGRQTSSFHDLRIFTDIPINILPNPNSGLAADHFHFWNLYLSPADIRPSVQAGAMLFTNTTFDGFQAWVGGSHGFYYNAPTSPGRGTNLSFYNVRTENNPAVTSDPTTYSFYMNVPNGVGNVLIKGAKLDEERQGIYARGILSLSVEQPYYPPVSPAAMKFLDVDTTVLNVNVRDARFESGVTQSLGGLNILDKDFVPSTAPVPTTAKYAVSAVGSLVKSGDISSGTFNNIILQTPGATATFIPGSGKTISIGSSLTLVGTDGTTQTFQGTGTVVNRNSTDTLTNKSISGATNTLTSIANASLVNSATTVNGQTCTLGSTCTVTAAASSAAVGSTTVTGGSPGRVLFDNAGVLGEYPITGTGNVALSASPTFTGNITASTLNNTIFTTPASTATLTLGSAKIATISNTLTFAGTDGSTLNVGTGGTLGSNAFTSTAFAPLASPTFTGTPAAPTAAVDTNTTQLATTAMVLGQAASATPLINGTAAVGTSTRYARGDHVHPTDTTRAALVSPSFTTPSLGVATATSINGVTIDNTAWTTYTPTVTGTTGSCGACSITPITGRSKQIGKTVFAQMSLTIAAIGSWGGALNITLPATSSTNQNVGTCFESATTGKSGAGFIAAGAPTLLSSRDAAAGSWWVNGYTLNCTVTYELP